MQYEIETFKYTDKHFTTLLDLDNKLLPQQWRNWQHLPMLKFNTYQLPSKAEQHIEFIKVQGEYVGYGVTRFDPWAYDPSELDSALILPDDICYQQLAYDYVCSQIDFAKAQKTVKLLRAWQFQKTKWGQQVYPNHDFEQTIVENASILHTTDFKAEFFQANIEKFYQHGFKIVTLNQLSEQDPNWDKKLFDLYIKIEDDVPTGHNVDTNFPFEMWFQAVFHPWQNKADLFIAMDNDTMIGLCHYDRSPNLITTADTTLSGVLPEYRRKSVCTALKCHSILQLIDSGIDTILTTNEVNNPMYQINLTMGFKQMNEEVGSKLKLY